MSGISSSRNTPKRPGGDSFLTLKTSTNSAAVWRAGVIPTKLCFYVSCVLSPLRSSPDILRFEPEEPREPSGV